METLIFCKTLVPTRRYISVHRISLNVLVLSALLLCNQTLKTDAVH